MISKNVSKIMVGENNFSEDSLKFISEAKLSKLKLIIKEIKKYSFGWDDSYKEDMNNLALIKCKSVLYHSIL